jgi:hypothetical protein
VQKANPHLAAFSPHPLGSALDAQHHAEKQKNDFNVRERPGLEASFGSSAAAAQADVHELDGDGGAAMDQVAEGILQFKALVGAQGAITLIAGIQLCVIHSNRLRQTGARPFVTICCPVFSFGSNSQAFSPSDLTIAQT